MENLEKIINQSCDRFIQEHKDIDSQDYQLITKLYEFSMYLSAQIAANPSNFRFEERFKKILPKVCKSKKLRRELQIGSTGAET